MAEQHGYEDAVDEFGRTLEEQLQDDIEWGYMVDRDQHSIHESTVSDDLYQDGDVPFGSYMTCEDGSLRFRIKDPYLAPWHRDKAIELLDDGYDALQEYWE